MSDMTVKTDVSSSEIEVLCKKIFEVTPITNLNFFG